MAMLAYYQFERLAEASLLYGSLAMLAYYQFERLAEASLLYGSFFLAFTPGMKDRAARASFVCVMQGGRVRIHVVNTVESLYLLTPKKEKAIFKY
jgi:hypothetical protein